MPSSSGAPAPQGGGDEPLSPTRLRSTPRSTWESDDVPDGATPLPYEPIMYGVAPAAGRLPSQVLRSAAAAPHAVLDVADAVPSAPPLPWQQQQQQPTAQLSSGSSSSAIMHVRGSRARSGSRTSSASGGSSAGGAASSWPASAASAHQANGGGGGAGAATLPYPAPASRPHSAVPLQRYPPVPSLPQAGGGVGVGARAASSSSGSSVNGGAGAPVAAASVPSSPADDVVAGSAGDQRRPSWGGASAGAAGAKARSASSAAAGLSVPGGALLANTVGDSAAAAGRTEVPLLPPLPVAAGRRASPPANSLHVDVQMSLEDAENGRARRRMGGSPHATSDDGAEAPPPPPAVGVPAAGHGGGGPDGTVVGVPAPLAPGESPADGLGRTVDLVAEVSTVLGHRAGRRSAGSGGGRAAAGDSAGAAAPPASAEPPGPCDLPTEVRRKCRSYLGKQRMKTVKTWKDLAKCVATDKEHTGGHYWMVWTLALSMVLVGLFFFMAAQYDFARSVAVNSVSPSAAPTLADGPHSLRSWLRFWRQSQDRIFSFEFLGVWGGRYAANLRDGQWWRWFTSLLVHQSFMHLVSNLSLFLVLSAYLESLYGFWRVIPVWLAAGLAGNMASAFFDNACTMVVGASGTVFGLLGMYLTDVGFNFETMPLLWLRLLGITACVVFMVTLQLFDKKLDHHGGISHASHLGGFFAGLLLSAPLLPDIKKRRAAEVEKLVRSLSLTDHLPNKASPPGCQLYSFWQRRRWALYILYGLGAVYVALVFVALPVYLYVHRFPRVTCEAINATFNG